MEIKRKLIRSGMCESVRSRVIKYDAQQQNASNKEQKQDQGILRILNPFMSSLEKKTRCMSKQNLDRESRKTFFFTQTERKYLNYKTSDTH